MNIGYLTNGKLEVSLALLDLSTRQINQKQTPVYLCHLVPESRGPWITVI